MIYDQDEDFALWASELFEDVQVYLAWCQLRDREDA